MPHNEWICEECASLFYKPAERKEKTFGCDGCGEALIDTEKVCPFCGSERISRMRPCPVCDCYMAEDRHICKWCQKKLHKKFEQFLGSLDANEVDQLDDWLDGASIADFESMDI